MNPPEYPTPWQKKSIWAALTTLAVVAIGAVAIGLIWIFSSVVAYLQPILTPFAIAGVLAYLLEPVVAKIVSWGTSRRRAVLAVFAVVLIALTGILIWVIPAIWTQAGNLARRVPKYQQRAEHLKDEVTVWVRSLEDKYLPPILKKDTSPAPPEETHGPAPTPENGATPAPSTKAPESSSAAPPSAANPAPNPPVLATTPTTASPDTSPNWIDLLTSSVSGDDWKTALTWLSKNVGAFLLKSVGGFLGIFGPLLSLIIVPIYLYYFLIESKNIAESWGDYLPLRASAFKDEVIAALEEINGYLIAFFRGQLLVSMINGTITGVLLVSFGLDFGLLIGLLLCFLGIIPYLGIALCWVPAVLLAAVQDSGTWIPTDHWWLFPAVVTAIFILVNQIDGLFVTPKIVGESVGLHPVTVIVSVLMWSRLLGGLLGAILAVPLTATLKVLLRRYVWERRIRAEESVIITEETVAVREAQVAGKPEVAASK
ncbi:MAG TPA: AI-2E family transporter [Chthoniobacter sp.]|jgi:predicted PurR-regulated permease PerM